MIRELGEKSTNSAGDLRPQEAPGREDQVQPYSRRGGEALNAATKSTYLGDTSGNSAYRWTLGLGGEPDLSKPYAQHPWVYAAVAAIGRASSSVPARLQRQLGGGEMETVTDSELASVLEIPNPLMSQRKFFRSVATAQQLYGETFIILLRRGKGGKMEPVRAVNGTGMSAIIEPPEELWPVRGDLAEALLDSQTKLPAAWRFQTAGGRVDYPAHAVVQIAEVNPYNPLRGMGPMQAAYRVAAKDFIIDRYDEALLQNGGSPGGVLSVDGPLTDADQRAIREAWSEAHGRPESHRKTAVLPQGTTYTEIGMSPQAMEHEKLREWDRQTILSIFGVPPVILGLETINYATAREQNRIFWDTTILPYLDFLKDELQYKLIRRINGPDSELTIDFDISGVSALREDMDSKVDRALKIYEKGHRTFSESAELAGWDITEEDLEGTDERYIPVNLAQVGSDSMPEPIGSEAVEEGAEEEERSAPEAREEEVVIEWPDWLDGEEKRVDYYRLYTEAEDRVIEKVAKRTKRVQRDMVLAARKRVREIAESAKGAPSGKTKAVITEAEIERLLELSLAKWGMELSDAIVAPLSEMMVEAAGILAGEMGVSGVITSVEHPFVVEFYSKYPVYLAEGPQSNLVKSIHKAILEAVTAEGVGSVTSLAEAIRVQLDTIESSLTDVFGGLDVRADRIASTETAKAYNGARMQEMKLNKIERHQWLSSRDPFVRDTHQAGIGVDGEIREVGERFSNGVVFPGEGPPAPASEVVNCRCTTIAVLNTES